MVLISLLILPIALLMEYFYIQDYWKPETFNGWSVGLEDGVFAFSVTGIASVIYEEIFRKKTKTILRQNYWFAFFFVILMMSSLIIFNILLKINSIYVTSIVFAVCSVILLVIRKDLIIDSLMSGIFLAILAVVLYVIFLFIFPGIIQEWWMLGNISNLLILGIPIEEIVWAFSWGLLAGPMYEFISGAKLRSLPNIK